MHKVKLFFLLLVFGLPLLAQAELSAERKNELRHLVKQDCGSCHGMTLKGGLGPALTSKVLSNKPRGTMLATVLYGRPGTPMPPWQTILSQQDAEWIIDQLYQGTLND